MYYFGFLFGSTKQFIIFQNSYEKLYTFYELKFIVPMFFTL